jgi:hypothetical protein
MDFITVELACKNIISLCEYALHLGVNRLDQLYFVFDHQIHFFF